MSDEHFNELEPHEVEALALLAEELGEAQQAIGKILRHGITSCHPVTKVSNRSALEHELGDVEAAISIAIRLGMVLENRINDQRRAKLDAIRPYLHHIDCSAAVTKARP